MTTQVELELQLGAKFYAEITCAESQTDRTHRAQVRVTKSTITTKMDLATGDGITISSTNSKVLILQRGATVTELIVCPTDSAIWAFDCESTGATADDVVREAEGSVLVTRDVTRATEATADANASKLLTYSLTDGQTLTTPEQTALQTKIGITGGGDITASQITDSTTAGRAILTAADASAQRAAMGLGTAATTAASDYATAAQGADDRTASGLRTATTVVSVAAGAAPSAGQVLTATSSAAATWQTPGGGMAIGGAVTGATTTRVLFTLAGLLANDAAFRWDGNFLWLSSTNANFLYGNAGDNSLAIYVGGGRQINAEIRCVTFGSWSGLVEVIKGPSAGTGNTNRAGTQLNIQAGESTGNGAGAGVAIYYAPSGSSGVSENAAVQGLLVDASGVAASVPFKPPSLADGSAPVNSIYYSTTASKLVYKDAGGTVNALY